MPGIVLKCPGNLEQFNKCLKTAFLKGQHFFYELYMYKQLQIWELIASDGWTILSNCELWDIILTINIQIKAWLFNILKPIYSTQCNYLCWGRRKLKRISMWSNSHILFSHRRVVFKHSKWYACMYEFIEDTKACIKAIFNSLSLW